MGKIRQILIVIFVMLIGVNSISKLNAEEINNPVVEINWSKNSVDICEILYTIGNQTESRFSIETAYLSGRAIAITNYLVDQSNLKSADLNEF